MHGAKRRQPAPRKPRDANSAPEASGTQIIICEFNRRTCGSCEDVGTWGTGRIACATESQRRRRRRRRYVKRLRFEWGAQCGCCEGVGGWGTGVILRAAVWRTPVLLKGEDKELGRDLAEHLNICFWLVGAQAEAYAT